MILQEVSGNDKLQRIFYMHICCICYWLHFGSNDVQIIRQVSRMDRKEAIERIQEVMTILRTQHMCKDMDGECTTEDRETYIQRFEALRIAIEALQEKDHRCDNCSNGENAGVRIYCLLHTSFHRLDEYCSEWEQK